MGNIFVTMRAYRKFLSNCAWRAKYAGNIFLARKVTFANVLAMAAERLGADYEHIRAGVSADNRIGASHLDVAHGGYRGFGGFCLPKDLGAFISLLTAIGLDNAVSLFQGDQDFNEKLLASQGLSVEDVSVHDHKWVNRTAQAGNYPQGKLLLANNADRGGWYLSSRPLKN